MLTVFSDGRVCHIEERSNPLLLYPIRHLSTLTLGLDELAPPKTSEMIGNAALWAVEIFHEL